MMGNIILMEAFSGNRTLVLEDLLDIRHSAMRDPAVGSLWQAAPSAGDRSTPASGGITATARSPEVCAVCLDYVNIGEKFTVLGCHHSFHSKCEAEWRRRAPTCPTCRR